MHDDETRLERIDNWRSIGIHEFLFLRTARSLTEVYIQFADEFVQPVLSEPDLAFAA